MSRSADIVAAVADVYSWIDEQTASWNGSCRACGKCCDFDQFDHRLFLTSVEMLHFRSTLPPDMLKPMTGGVCPHRLYGKCAVYEARFAGCRIFSCTGPPDAQNRLSEKALRKFKAICERFDVPYTYMDLKMALNGQ